MHGFISGCLFCLLIYVSVFVLVLFCFDLCGFVAYSENREQDASSSILLSQDCFNYWIQENMQTFLHGLQYSQNVKRKYVSKPASTHELENLFASKQRNL